MNTILQALTDRGVNPDDTVLIGTLRHVPAGEKKHWNDTTVQVFKPAASHLRVVHKDGGEDLLTFTCEGDSLVDDKAFWANLKTPEGVNPADVIALALGLVSSHRDLTGMVAGTYEMIEFEAAEIERILARRTELPVGLTHLTTFLEKDSALFEALMEHTTGGDGQRSKNTVYDQLRFERDSLLHALRIQPCERDLYDSLRKEYAEGPHVGLGFDNYYNWFRRSEAQFAMGNGIPAEGREAMKFAMNAWLTVADKPTEDWVEDKKKLFFRNFQVHPRHREQVGEALSEVLSGIEEERASTPAKAAKP